MRGAIQRRDELRDLSETRKKRHWQAGGIAETGEGQPQMERGATGGPGAPQKRSCLVNHVDSFLRGLIEGGYRLGICLEGTLGDDQRRKLGRDVHIGRL
jgi:hypothetical protein